MKQLLIISLLLFVINNAYPNKQDTVYLDSIYNYCLNSKHTEDSITLVKLNELTDILAESKYQERYVKALVLKANILAYHDFNKSIENLLKASRIVDKQNNLKLKIEVNKSFISVYSREYDFENAYKYVKESFNLIDNINDDLLLSRLYNQIGNFYSDCSGYFEAEAKLEKIDSAILFYNKSIKLAYLVPDTALIIKNNTYKGICYYNISNFDKALKSYRKALKYSELFNDSIDMAANFVNIGSIYFDEQKYDTALTYYYRAYNIFNDYSFIRQIYRTGFRISNTYLELGDYKNAYNYYISSTNILDSIYDVENKKQINNLLIEYETEKTENELKVERAKKRNRNLIIIGLVIAIAFIIIITLFLIKSSRDKNKLIKKEVELKNQEINKLLKEQELQSFAAMLEGQDKERQRIASDLHDRIGGILSTIKTYFQAIDDKIDKLEEKTIKQYGKAGKLLNEAVDEVRDISHNLSSGVLKNFGLLVAIDDLKQTIELSGSLKIELFISGDKQNLDAALEIEIYRIIQELFSNTMKHANAEKVMLQFNFNNSNINIIFEDDGDGFDLSKQKKGIGLKNIEVRIMKLKGDFNIDTRIGRGTIVLIDIPII